MNVQECYATEATFMHYCLVHKNQSYYYTFNADEATNYF